ncbi:hypothetical protein SAY86_025143 [Trapa natans]|uniref:Uncharacterized protein n=1 Tax=Trapa natans TaxID=22666 RepID=A0AAN7MWF9_TRANT|nr:hypothetical protein SAY86_025143 [Trapa natans]
MGTEVQMKMFSSEYLFKENDKGENIRELLNCDNNTIVNGNQSIGFSRWPMSDKYVGCEKEELRQMILKQEAIFRHQLQELHRLYKIQGDLMNEVKSKDLSKSLPASSTFQSTLVSSNDESKQQLHNFLSGLPRSGKIATSEVAQIAFKSKVGGTINRQLLDLKLPADRCYAKEQEVPRYSESGLQTEELSASTFADIPGCWPREKLQVMDRPESLQANFHARGLLNNPMTVQLSSTGSSFASQTLHGEIQAHPFGSRQVDFVKILKPVSLSSDHQSSVQQTSNKLFGVEISQRSHGRPEPSLQELPAVLSMNFMKPVQGPCIVNGGLLDSGHRQGKGSYQMTHDSLLVNFPQFVGMNKKEVGMPHCLVQGTYGTVRTVGIIDQQGNGKAHGSYLDKSHSVNGVGSFNSNVMDNSRIPSSAAMAIKYTVDNEQSFERKNTNICRSREFLDLNVCPPSSEEETLPTLHSETSHHIMSTRGEIDLEVPVHKIGESSGEGSTSSKQGSSVISDAILGEKNDEPLRVATGTLVAMSTFPDEVQEQQILPDEVEDMNDEILHWFAEISISSLPVSSSDSDLLEMDYFELATLNLAETKVEELSYKPPASEELQETSSSAGRIQKGHGRRGRRKDFQRDVLPGLTSLSRNEVTKDLQTIEGLIKATDRAERAGLMQKNSSASRDGKARGRAKRRNVDVDNEVMKPPAAEEPKCRVLSIKENALVGWGKRARRPRRSRCSAAVHPLHLKEVF